MAWLRQVFAPQIDPQSPAPLTRVHWLLFALGLAAAALARFLLLDRIPPGLWFDEALYCLDGYHVSQGDIAIFFAEGGHPREPLFPWLLGAAFALFQPTVLVARCVSALCGTAAVAMFFPVALRFFTPRWALAATAAFAVFRWHIHFSRTIFRAGLASTVILLVVWMFLRWREKRRRLDAAACGVALGVCLYTYISLRIAPALVGLWIIGLAFAGRLSLRREWKQIAILYGTMLLVFAPLGMDYLRHPDHLTGRTDEISMFEKTVRQAGPDGVMQDVRVPKSTGEALTGIGRNALQVAGAWFVLGDYVAKHNIPLRPVLDPVTGLLFLLGLCVATWALLRTGSTGGLMLLTWFGGFAMASVLSFGAPNILRMQGASPVVILLMVLGLSRVISAWPPNRSPMLRRVVPVLILGFFAVTQLYDYFIVFPRDLRVRQEFTADIFYEPAHAVDEIAPLVSKVYVPAELMESLQVKFATIRRKNIIPYGPDAPLPGAPDSSGPTSAAWLVTARSMSLADHAGVDQSTQLQQMAGLRRLQTFGIPQPDETGKFTGETPWAELWFRR